MKNLKMLQAALAIAILSFVTGCSDQITSSGEPGVTAPESEIRLDASGQIDRPLFHDLIKLKSNRSYTFNYSNTGLISFNSIKVERVHPATSDDVNWDPCKDIKILSNVKEKSELSCNSSNFDLKEITVLYTGAGMILLDVVLTGRKYIVDTKELEQ